MMSSMFEIPILYVACDVKIVKKEGVIFLLTCTSKNTVTKSLISILGGGDTLAAIKKSRDKLSFTHLSTAGGAFLEYLEGKDLPGLTVLK